MAGSHVPLDDQNNDPGSQSVKVPGFFIVTAWRWVLGLTIASAVTAAILGILMATGLIPNPLKRKTKTVIQEIILPDDGSLTAAQKANRRLKDQLARLKDQLKNKKKQCVKQAEAKPPKVPKLPKKRLKVAESDPMKPDAPREPHERKPVEPKPPRLSKEDTCRLCAENIRTLRGSMSISLTWQGFSDLDLHLICPNGDHVYYKQKKMPSCGARLNHDMNDRTGENRSPIENITLDKNAPAGTYRIAVAFFAKRTDPRTSVPLRISTIGIPGITAPIEKIARYPDHKNSPYLTIKSFTLAPNRSVGKPVKKDGFVLDCSICEPRP